LARRLGGSCDIGLGVTGAWEGPPGGVSNQAGIVGPWVAVDGLLKVTRGTVRARPGHWGRPRQRLLSPKAPGLRRQNVGVGVSLGLFLDAG